jgi:hypothetical protein
MALVLERLDQALTELEQAGKHVTLVLDNPRLPDPAHCMERSVLAVPGLHSALALGTRPAARNVSMDLKHLVKSVRV